MTIPGLPRSPNQFPYTKTPATYQKEHIAFYALTIRTRTARIKFSFASAISLTCRLNVSPFVLPSICLLCYKDILEITWGKRKVVAINNKTSRSTSFQRALEGPRPILVRLKAHEKQWSNCDFPKQVLPVFIFLGRSSWRIINEPEQTKQRWKVKL